MDNSVYASTIRLTGDANWSSDLQAIDVVVHTAARVHVMRETALDSLAEFRRVNVEGTARLARQAVVAGVKRFIFLSSIKVNGEATMPGRPFTAEDTPAFEDAYGQSKLEAEQALQAIARTSSMEVVIIRPPLVYGPSVKGNMAALMRLVAHGVPLPLGAIHNKRSLVALDNLVDLMTISIEHPAAANQVFLVSDGMDISTSELIRTMAQAMGKTAWLVPLPPALLRLVARVIGKPTMVRRLCDSLQVDIQKTRDVLGWNPPLSVREGFGRMMRVS